MEGTALDDDVGDRTATAVEVRLDGDTLGLHVRVDHELVAELDVGREEHLLQQRLDIGALLGGDVDEHGVAAVLLGDQTVLGELATDLVRGRALLVDLVHRDHDRDLGGLGVVDRLHRLRHDTVVGGHDQDGDVGGLGTTGTHGGERLVTRGIQQGQQTLLVVDLHRHLVGTDVLGDAAGLAATDVGLADRVQQSGLTVVDVTHHGDHRRAVLEVLGATLVLTEGQVEGLQQLAVLVLRGDDLDLVVHLLAEELQGVIGHRGGRGDHLTEVEHRLDQCSRIGVDLLGEVGQGGTATQADAGTLAVRQLDAADHRRCLHCLVLVTLLPLRLTSTTRSATGTSEGTCGTAATSAAGTTATRAAALAAAGAAVAATATAAATGAGLGRHLSGAGVARHGGGAGTTSTLSARLRGAAALGRCALLAAGTRSRTAGGATGAGHVGLALTTAGTRGRTVRARGERVVRHARGAATGLRLGAARLRARTCTRLRGRTVTGGGVRIRCGCTRGRARARLAGLGRTRGGAGSGGTGGRAGARGGLRCGLGGRSRLRGGGPGRLSSTGRSCAVGAACGICGGGVLRCRGSSRLGLRSAGLGLGRTRLGLGLGSRGVRRRGGLGGRLRAQIGQCGRTGGRLGRGGANPVMVLHLLDDRRFHRRGRRLHKLTLLLERGEKFLAGHVELLCQLMDT